MDNIRDVCYKIDLEIIDATRLAASDGGEWRKSGGENP